MNHERPLYLRLYFDAVYVAVARAVGYQGCTYRRLTEIIEELAKEFPKVQVESATYHCLTFEGQMTCNPKPLAKVELRTEVRKLCWQLLGPPPEHPLHGKLQGPALPNSWDKPPEQPEEPQGKPKRKRTKK
jgi:hypothetical protein